jgi:hypothetical protein
VKLYTLTISAHVDDLETLDVHLDANVEVADPSLRQIALSVIPAHLRKIAADVEQQAAETRTVEL